MATTLYLSRYILPEQLYPWLSVVSGLLVVVIGSIAACPPNEGGTLNKRPPTT
ncbi:MAG: hypothetical protein WKH64_10560 [Chloroflexia bacterium]